MTADPDPDSPRPRLGIISVLDRTGSMGFHRKLETARTALSHLLTHLGPDDAVGLVTFAEDARVVVAPDATAQGAFAEALGAVRAGGPTNLAAGLEAGVAAARVLAASWSEDDRPFEIRVLIVSDGLANVGVTSPDAIAAVASDLPSGVRVSAIGLGADCDHDLLAAITVPSGGSYGFAEGAADVPRLVGAELGSALSVAASDLTVTVTPRRYATLGRPLGLRSEDAPSGGVGAQIPVLCADETRHVVIPVTLNPPGRRHARAVTIAEVEVAAPGSEPQTVLPKVRFDGSEPQPVPSLVEVVDRAKVAAAFEEANRAASAGRFDMATTVLSNASVSSSTSQTLLANAAYYFQANTYGSSAPERASTLSALSATGRLLGSSDQFDATWSRTMGSSYQTPSMRRSSALLDQLVSSDRKGSDKKGGAR